jgi:hypothetical protein
MPERRLDTQERLKAQAFYSAFEEPHGDFERGGVGMAPVVNVVEVKPEWTRQQRESAYANSPQLSVWRDGRSLAARPEVLRATKDAYYLFPDGSKVATGEMVKIASGSPYRELLENCMYQPTGNGYQRRPKKLLRHGDGKRGEWQPGPGGSVETYVQYAKAMLWLADYLEERQEAA